MLVCLFLPMGVQAAGDTVYVVEIIGDIDKTIVTTVEKAFSQAQKLGATRIFVELDTYGGYVDSAIRIKDTIMASEIPVTCCVANKAISAGALIALAGNDLLMAPGSVIGAAEPRDGSETADEKYLSMWRAELSAAAEARGKDGTLAAAMADSSIVIKGLSEEGKLLTLTDTQSVALGIADGTFQNRADVLARYDLGEARVIENEITFQEQLGRFLTNPVIAPILLTVGIAGLVLELITAGFGIFGVLGLAALTLYFAGGILAGYAGWLAVFFVVLGLILLVLEIFVIPGFGIAGITGLAALVGGIVAVSPSWEQAVFSLLIAIIATVALITLSTKYTKTRKIWGRLVLWGKLDRENGYNS
ncbi:MAG: ATP-dependent Clp protease proteolytic subunit, partial [Clostridiales bacterium]